MDARDKPGHDDVGVDSIKLAPKARRVARLTGAIVLHALALSLLAASPAFATAMRNRTPSVEAAAKAAAPKPVKLELKAGQAVVFPAKIEDGKVTLGPARLGKFGEIQPGDGEIAVGLSPKDKTLYETVVVVEKTSAPVDFLATGLIGNIKIDEVDVKGQLDGPFEHRIGATSWTVWLNGFEPGAVAATQAPK